MRTEYQLDVRFADYCESPMQIVDAVTKLPAGHYLHVLHRMAPLIVFKILQIEGFTWHTKHGDNQLPVELFIWRVNDKIAKTCLIAEIGDVISEQVETDVAIEGLAIEKQLNVKILPKINSLVKVGELSAAQVQNLQAEVAVKLGVKTIFSDYLQDESKAPTMAIIPAGQFNMGDITRHGYSLEKPAHSQVIEENFAIGIYPVTVAEFTRFANATSYKTKPEQGYHHERKWHEWEKETLNSWRNPGFSQDEKHPVTVINQIEATDYCAWLSSQTGHTYRLATEAEWEYACRAGSEADWYFGNDETQLADYAWYRENSAGRTHPVGEKKPNAFGLYDMHGNIWEWTSSQYTHKNYNFNSSCFVRGGSWDNKACLMRASSFSFRVPLDNNSRLGFRVVRVF